MSLQVSYHQENAELTSSNFLVKIFEAYLRRFFVKIKNLVHVNYHSVSSVITVIGDNAMRIREAAEL